MLAWMLYVVLVTLLLGVAALAAERAARLRRAPCRWVWILAMTSSLLVPAIVLSVPVEPAAVVGRTVADSAGAPRQPTSGTDSPAHWIRVDAMHAISSRSLDSWLRRGWILASTSLLALLLASSASLWWKRRGWTIRSVAGVPVYVAPDVGPAVVGLFRPRIVVPAWLSDLAPAQQALVIAHETVHLEARDPQVLAAALCLLLCAPWNVPLWWQVLRLRRAIEVDCDAGVLRSGVDARRYGETLLAVGRRQSPSIASAAAMSEPQSFLEERITLMLRKPSKSWTLMAATLSGLSLTLVAVATQVAPPQVGSAARATQVGDPGKSAGQPVLASVSPQLLDAYAGYFQYGQDAEFTTVLREGDHLLVEFPGLPVLAMYPHSPTLFFGKDTDARLSFTLDAGGQASAAVLLQNGASTPMRRIDAATAEKLRAAVAAKVHTQTPNPASEAMLRRVIDGIVSGKPNLKEMNPQLAAAIHHDLPKLQGKLADLGAVQSIQLLSVSNAGMDVYEVRHERGTSQWSIALDSRGTLIGAMVPL